MIAETTLLDHAPFILDLDAVSHSLVPRSHRIRDSIYTLEELSRCIVDIWTQDWSEVEDIAV